MVLVPLVVGLGALVAVILLVLLFQYNRMVSLRNRCKESWSNVDAELLRRHDLIPNLVAAVKGYAAHEAAVFKQVSDARARAAAVAHAGAAAQNGAESDLSRATGRLLAVAEAYPRLQASANFLQLQQELSITEDRIQAARRFYNGNVRDYRNQGTTIPGVWFAGMWNMGQIEFFQVDAAVRAAPAVGLGG